MVPKFEEWAYEEERTEGELDIIYAPEYGYFVVGYLGLKEQSEDILSQTALKQLSQEILDEIDQKKHDFHTDDVFLPAPAGPTATPVPDYAIPTEGVVFNPDSTAVTTPAAQLTGTTTKTDVLIWIFFILAGIAIIAVIVILIISAMKNGKGGSSQASSQKSSKKKSDEENSRSSKKGRRPAEEEDDGDEEDSEEDEEDDEDDE